MKRSFALVFAALLLAGCASSNKSDTQQANAAQRGASAYSSEGTTMPVGAIPAATLHDPQRNRDIDLSIEYPTKGGPYPVIIFSPEYGGSRADYVSLSAYWTSHGYVVIKMSHADAGVLRDVRQKEADERRAAMDQQRERRGRRDTRQPQTPQQPQTFRADIAETRTLQQTPADFQNRVADIRFIIDSLPRLIEQFPEIKDRVDATRIGVGGHAYGALTALLTAGVRTFSGATAASYADPRVKAVVAMSPPGTGTARGLTNESFANLRVPVLFLTGTRDAGALETEDLAWRRQGFELSPAGDKWFVAINGVGRSAFTGIVGDFGGYIPDRPMDMPYPTNRPPVGGTYPSTQPMPRTGAPMPSAFGQSGTVRTISLAFWDTYLKTDTAGREYLNKLKDRGDLQVATK